MSHQFRFLPPEILKAILVPSISYQIINLWKCGDTQFNERLSAIITEVDLRHDKLLPSKYPRLLSRLNKLKSLTLISPTSLFVDPHDWLTELNCLSKTLESIEIRTDDSRHAFVHHTATWTEAKRSYIETDYGLGKCRLIDIATVLPKLSSINISHPRTLFPTRIERPPLRLDDLIFGLPSSITILALPNFLNIAESNDTKNVFSILPRSLTELRAIVFLSGAYDFSPSGHENIRTDWSSAPPNLKLIKLLMCPSFIRPEDLPRALESMCEVTRDLSLDEAEYGDVRNRWPPNLQKMTLGLISPANTSKPISAVNWGLQLPASLTELKIDGTLNEPILGANIIHLPRTLASLSIEHTVMDLSTLEAHIPDFGDESGFLQNFWPPSLTALTIRLKGFAPRFLPRTLRTLDASFQKEDVSGDELEIAMSELPPTLIKFHLDFKFSCKAVLVGTAPKTLESFTVWRTDPSLGCLEAKAMDNLPDTLTLLKVCPVLPLLANTPWKLPSKLTRLEIVDWHCHWVQKVLPKTLTHFDAFRISGLSNASSTIISEMFNDLPPLMQYFTISHPYTGENRSQVMMSLRAFQGLKYLTYLDVSKAIGTFASESLRIFSRELRTMKLRMAKISADDVPFFPPLLRVIDINYECVDWSIRDLAKYWPLRDTGTGDNGPGSYKQRRAEEQRKLYH